MAFPVSFVSPQKPPPEWLSRPSPGVPRHPGEHVEKGRRACPQHHPARGIANPGYGGLFAEDAPATQSAGPAGCHHSQQEERLTPLRRKSRAFPAESEENQAWVSVPAAHGQPHSAGPRNRSVLRYRSPVLGRMTTISLFRFCSRRAMRRAAAMAAPDEMPHSSPSLLARSLATS